MHQAPGAAEGHITNSTPQQRVTNWERQPVGGTVIGFRRISVCRLKVKNDKFCHLSGQKPTDGDKFFYLFADSPLSSELSVSPAVLRRGPSALFRVAQVGTPSFGRSHCVSTM
jgi:hypothetical protein